MRRVIVRRLAVDGDCFSRFKSVIVGFYHVVAEFFPFPFSGQFRRVNADFRAFDVGLVFAAGVDGQTSRHAYAVAVATFFAFAFVDGKIVRGGDAHAVATFGAAKGDFGGFFPLSGYSKGRAVFKRGFHRVF